MTKQAMQVRCIYRHPIKEYDSSSIMAFAVSTENTYDLPEYVKTRGDTPEFSVKGYGVPHDYGIEYILEGEWHDTKWGPSMTMQAFRVVEPKNVAGIRKFLESECIKGVGSKTADRIIAKFGKDALEILSLHPARYLEIKGISEKKLDRILKSYQETTFFRNLFELLGGESMDIRTAKRIFSKHGQDSLDIIRNTPYILCSDGFKFTVIDNIAMKLGADLMQIDRFEAVFTHLFKEAEHKGDCCLPWEFLSQQALNLLNGTGKPLVTIDTLSKAANEMIKKKIFASYQKIIVPIRFDTMERELAARLIHLNAIPMPSYDKKVYAHIFEEWKLSQTVVLANKQEAAVKFAITSRVFLLTGGPGTGKTTTLKAIIDLSKITHPEEEIVLLAPTGKAARRMRESTGLPTSTIHKYLLRGTKLSADFNPDEITLYKKDPIAKKEASKDPPRLFVIDESSMADLETVHALVLLLTDRDRIIFVGDKDQLSSVGAGDVFSDLLRSQAFKTVCLDVIYRQGKDSLIISNSAKINHGNTDLVFDDEEFIFKECTNDEEVCSYIKETYVTLCCKQGKDNVILLSPFRRKTSLGSNSLNRELQALINPAIDHTPAFVSNGQQFRIGDRVMQEKNNELVSNGDIGTVMKIIEVQDEDGFREKSIEILFDSGDTVSYNSEQMEHVSLAYSSTVHKAQGDERQTIIMPIVKAHSIMLTRRLLYTAVTRAKKKVVLVGDPASLKMAISNVGEKQRFTLLADRLHALGIKQKFAAQIQTFLLRRDKTP